MPDSASPPLPNRASWRFDAIACSEPDRARKLESAGIPRALLCELGDALDHALDSRNVRIGREHAGQQWDDCRIVVQFGVHPDVFDWFFNGRTGYRAHFRAHHTLGCDFNGQIIDAVRDRLARLPETIPGRDLDSQFEDRGEVLVSKNFVLTSLVPDLSKVWFCVKRIRTGGGIELLPTGVVGPPLLLNGDVRWAAPYREQESAWLDVKGAFIGESGLYQPKDPIGRARTLQATGQA